MKPIAAPSASWLAALVLVACSSTKPEQIEGRTDSGARPETQPTSAASGAQSMQPMLERICADAAQRAGVALDQVKVLTVESVTWSDGSLGCPEPGMMYTQALVRGNRVRVDAAGTILLYHSGAQNTFVHCPADRAREPSPIDPT
jgi:hypothetical protein